MYCSVPRCGLPAYCYCQTDSKLLCRSHVGQHRDQGHEIFLYECDLCGGHGRVHGQYARASPGGSWVRCPKCFGTGFLRDPTRNRGYRARTEERSRAGGGHRTGDRTHSGGGTRAGEGNRADSREPVDASIDYYTVLGVSSVANSDAIKKAYRRLIKHYHPDLNPGSQEALDKTKALNRAYDILGNSERRREYDRQRTEGSAEATESARRTREAEKRARAAEWVAREAAQRSERGRRGRDAASKGGDRGPAQETQGRNTDGGRGQHRGCKRLWRRLILTFLVLLIAGGVVGAGMGLPYLIDEGGERVPPPTSTPLPTSTPTPMPTATPTPGPKPVGGQLLDPLEIETWIVHYTNVERRNAGLTPFVLDPAISKIARMHSQNMVRLDIFSHAIGGKDPTDRALDNGYDCRAYWPDGSYSYGLSENIAKHPRVTQWIGTSLFGVSTSYRPDIFDEDSKAMAFGLVEGWMNSPGHRENILDGDSRRIGVGVAILQEEEYDYADETVFATQNFSACK